MLTFDWAEVFAAAGETESHWPPEVVDWLVEKDTTAFGTGVVVKVSA